MTLITFLLGFTAVSGWLLLGMALYQWKQTEKELDAVRVWTLRVTNWWMEAQDKLDAIHENHVRAGRTPHDRRREKAKDKTAQLAISPPAPLPSRKTIMARAHAALRQRREKLKV